MRLQLIVDDNLSPELKSRIIAITERLSAHPEFASQIPLEDEEDAIQKMFTPDRLASIASADADIDAGNAFSAAQVDEFFAQKETSWAQTHPH